MGKREEAKARNKERILSAARELMQTQGGGLSMRDLAELAGVSVATPYNLFGSKQDVIMAVLDADLAVLRESVAEIDGDPIDGLFGVIDVMIGMLESAPSFYQSGAVTVQINLNAEVQHRLRAPRHDVLRQLVQRAVQEDYITHQVNPDLFAILLGQTLMIWVNSWANEFVTLEQLKNYAIYDFATTLAGVVKDQHHDRVMQIALEAQNRLQSDWPAEGQLPINVAGSRS